MHMDEFMILLNCNISGGESFDYNYYELLMKYIIISPRIPSLFQNNNIHHHYNCGCCRCCSNNNWMNLI